MTGVVNKLELVLKTILNEIADDPSSVELNIVQGHSSFLIEVIANQEDRKHLIGREGKMAHALRVVASAIGARHGKSVDLKVVGL